MAKFTRLVAVLVGLGVAGLSISAFAFGTLGAAHSDSLLLVLAVSLVAGNFALLRQGVRWAVRPVRPSELETGSLVLRPTH